MVFDSPTRGLNLRLFLTLGFSASKFWGFFASSSDAVFYSFNLASYFDSSQHSSPLSQLQAGFALLLTVSDGAAPAISPLVTETNMSLPRAPSQASSLRLPPGRFDPRLIRNGAEEERSSGETSSGRNARWVGHGSQDVRYILTFCFSFTGWRASRWAHTDADTMNLELGKAECWKVDGGRVASARLFPLQVPVPSPKPAYEGVGDSHRVGKRSVGEGGTTSARPRRALGTRPCAHFPAASTPRAAHILPPRIRGRLCVRGWLLVHRGHSPPVGPHAATSAYGLECDPCRATPTREHQERRGRDGAPGTSIAVRPSAPPRAGRGRRWAAEHAQHAREWTTCGAAAGSVAAKYPMPRGRESMGRAGHVLHSDIAGEDDSLIWRKCDDWDFYATLPPAPVDDLPPINLSWPPAHAQQGVHGGRLRRAHPHRVHKPEIWAQEGVDQLRPPASHTSLPLPLPPLVVVVYDFTLTYYLLSLLYSSSRTVLPARAYHEQPGYHAHPLPTSDRADGASSSAGTSFVSAMTLQ
ncbi:hypothetical protein DFH07DRAFT_1065963 [Mycena maculata]|uniref:Uncharacterized protein n=1 Tax=Mycena maculata TaxID=230809 RepID=A0AAD7MSE2_9AGAR|nr:hypothetical protein DFH07DRAFT_1065963 [Mycena maculata]